MGIYMYKMYKDCDHLTEAQSVLLKVRRNFQPAR